MKFSMLSTVLRPVVLPTVTALALLVAFWSPAAAAGPSIFVDKNGNGVFDGSDVDVTQTFKTTGVVDTTDSIVVPEGAVVRLSLNSASLHAGKGIHVSGTMSSTGSLFFRTEAGPIVFHPRSLVTVYDVLQVTAGTDLLMDTARLQSYDVLMMESIEGQIQVNKGILYGVNRLELNGYSPAGGLKITGTTLQAPRGLLNVHVEGTVEVEQAKLSSVDLNVSVNGGFAEICWSTVRVAASTGVVMVSVESVTDSSSLAATGSVLDMTGTKVYASAGNIVMSADQLVGY